MEISKASRTTRNEDAHFVAIISLLALTACDLNEDEIRAALLAGVAAVEASEIAEEAERDTDFTATVAESASGVDPSDLDALTQ